MLTMARIDDIREEYFRKGKSIAEIARERRLDRKTVRKYIEKDDFSEDPLATDLRKENPCPKLDPFKPAIDSWLEADKRARRNQRHTAKRVFDRLRKEEGSKDVFDCSYRTVATYVAWKKKQIYSGAVDAAIPLTHKPGEAQIDFGGAQFIHAGESCRWRSSFRFATG
jgi:transposase